MSEGAILANPFWYALVTDHQPWAITQGLAARYPAEVLPFAGIREASAQAIQDLRDVMVPGESCYLLHEPSANYPGFLLERSIPCWRMVLPRELAFADNSTSEGAPVRRLGDADLPAMLALVELAYPGFFRQRTPELGRYFGIFEGGELVAMGGERVALPGWREISTVCTHPAHTGRGHSRRILSLLLRLHREEGLRSMLHVTATNQRAIRLYEHLGFRASAEPLFVQLRRQ